MGSAAIVAVAGFGALGLVVGFGWWCISWARASSADARAQEVASVKAAAAVDTRDDKITELTGERDRADAARKKAEEIANRAISRFAKSAGADELVDVLNDELSALSELSDLSRAPTPRAGEGSDGEGTVHGAPQPPPLPDAPEG